MINYSLSYETKENKKKSGKKKPYIQLTKIYYLKLSFQPQITRHGIMGGKVAYWYWVEPDVRFTKDCKATIINICKELKEKHNNETIGNCNRKTETI